MAQALSKRPLPSETRVLRMLSHGAPMVDVLNASPAGGGPESSHDLERSIRQFEGTLLRKFPGRLWKPGRCRPGCGPEGRSFVCGLLGPGS
jgi:hypothetical protein